MSLKLTELKDNSIFGRGREKKRKIMTRHYSHSDRGEVLWNDKWPFIKEAAPGARAFKSRDSGTKIGAASLFARLGFILSRLAIRTLKYYLGFR